MYRTMIEPRVSETDGLGHINNTVAPVWLEAGRNKLFKLFNANHSFKDWKMIIVNMNIDYVRAIYFGKNVEVRTWVKKIGTTSLQLYEEIWQNETCCVKGTTTYVHYNREKQLSEPLPEEVRKELKKHCYR
ncbi:acyl-CoA thioesterase [Oceanobacillus sp. M65]|uniref:acyl-CoA thioesterase n=1 Tax=Oceanobacillus sp. M65 TaxID=3457435 RepID=UPI003FCDD2A8